MKAIIIILLAGALASCGVTYEGKYGTYSATPTGYITIKPHYAK